MYSTHIRIIPPTVINGQREDDRTAKRSFDLTRDEAYANAKWAMANAYSIVVTSPEGEYVWRKTSGWKFRKEPNI